ncbi:hypothetical protein ELI48_08460 [Rhizobium ruizarguesonis]|uniref:hypothetical protein n=1 Tax=Rhizobium ruizarguesonis TaxID=2081791 RepID=UPI001030400F|nr:hypothetical protein [Rhizobium ruizarguesonis]TAU26205.1 hypothetical protein ELI48_08460 [Rhizobium ruizarguesonis]
MTSIAIDRVDGLSSAAAIKGPCRCATTANIALYGEQTIDGIAAVTGNRVLVKTQTASYENGIYVADTGQWRRSKDFNRNNDVVEGTQVLVTDGNTYERSLWCVVSQNPIVIGTAAILFNQTIVSAVELEAAKDAAEAAAAAAAASAIAAAGYAALARNDVVVNSFTGDGVTTDFTLTVDPGSANNMRVNVAGATQLHASYSLVYVSTVPKIRFSEAPPNGVAFEVEMGFRIAVGSPATGSVTYDKIQNITATLRLLGRKTAGAGVTEEVAPNEMRPFFPDGAVVQSARATYTANAAISATIPMDNTIPQITEGAEILTLAITPTSTTNKFRIRWSGQAASTIANAQMIWGIFKGGQANALSAGFVNSDVVNAGYQMDGGAEYVPGVLTAQTVSVRVGTNTSGGASMRLNGTTAAAFLGGASAAELIVEEIKA